MYFFYLYFAHFVPNFGRCSISKLSFWRAFRRLFIVHTPPKPPLSINHHLVCISMCVCVTSHVLSSTHIHTLSYATNIYTNSRRTSFGHTVAQSVWWFAEDWSSTIPFEEPIPQLPLEARCLSGTEHRRLLRRLWRWWRYELNPIPNLAAQSPHTTNRTNLWMGYIYTIDLSSFSSFLFLSSIDLNLFYSLLFFFHIFYS